MITARCTKTFLGRNRYSLVLENRVNKQEKFRLDPTKSRGWPSNALPTYFGSAKEN